MARETRISVLEVGVEMWKVTLSKSETTWSIAVGVALRSLSWGEGRWVLLGYAPFCKSVSQERLDEDVLVVEKKHCGCRCGPVPLGVATSTQWLPTPV